MPSGELPSFSEPPSSGEPGGTGSQRGLNLIPIRDLQIVSLGSPLSSWASVSLYINHMQPITKEPYHWSLDWDALEMGAFWLGPSHGKVQHLFLQPSC